MALTAGTGAGEYLQKEEWLALGKESALVAIVVTAHGTTHMTKGPSAGKDVDSVRFDLYILSGSRRGEVLPGQDSIGRGIVTPLKRCQVGEEVAYVVGQGVYAGNPYPQLNAPDDLPAAAIELFESLKTSSPSAPATNGTKVPATVGASAGVAGDATAEDDDPPF